MEEYASLLVSRLLAVTSIINYCYRPNVLFLYLSALTKEQAETLTFYLREDLQEVVGD